MGERCPLTSGSSPGFYHGEEIPEICMELCEELWDRTVTRGVSEHEEYPSYHLSSPECPHYATEHGNSSLQATQVNTPVRLYTTTERCMGCKEEVGEDSFTFECPNF